MKRLQKPPTPTPHKAKVLLHPRATSTPHPKHSNTVTRRSGSTVRLVNGSADRSRRRETAHWARRPSLHYTPHHLMLPRVPNQTRVQWQYKSWRCNERRRTNTQVETQPHNMHTFLLKRNEKRGSSLDITYEKRDTSFSNNPFSFFSFVLFLGCTHTEKYVAGREGRGDTHVHLHRSGSDPFLLQTRGRSMKRWNFS